MTSDGCFWDRHPMVFSVFTYRVSQKRTATKTEQFRINEPTLYCKIRYDYIRICLHQLYHFTVFRQLLQKWQELKFKVHGTNFANRQPATPTKLYISHNVLLYGFTQFLSSIQHPLDVYILLAYSPPYRKNTVTVY